MTSPINQSPSPVAPLASSNLSGSVPAAAPTAPTSPTSPKTSRHVLDRVWREWIRPMAVVLLLVFGFRSMVLDWNVVPSGSMRPTILEGDFILVNKLAFDLRVPFFGGGLLTWGHPQRGEIVVFIPPGETERFVKRVIGVPGDLIEMRDNQLYINGERVEYEVLDAQLVRDLPMDDPGVFAQEVLGGKAHAVARSLVGSPMDTFNPIRLLEGQYFMLGDNRDNSRDSRAFGPVPRERILGRASRVAVSFDYTQNSRPRWSRFFQKLS